MSDVVQPRSSGGEVGFGDSGGRRMSVTSRDRPTVHQFLAPVHGPSGAHRSSSHRRRSIVAGSLRTDTSYPRSRTPTKLPNTLQLEPSVKFKASVVKRVVNQVLEGVFSAGCDALSEAGRDVALYLSETIRARVMNMGLDRYKLVCEVLLAESEDLSLQYASRCLLNERFDGYASVTFTKPGIHIVATVFAFYLD